MTNLPKEILSMIEPCSLMGATRVQLRVEVSGDTTVQNLYEEIFYWAKDWEDNTTKYSEENPDIIAYVYDVVCKAEYVEDLVTQLYIHKGKLEKVFYE